MTRRRRSIPDARSVRVRACALLCVCACVQVCVCMCVCACKAVELACASARVFICVRVLALFPARMCRLEAQLQRGACLWRTCVCPPSAACISASSRNKRGQRCPLSHPLRPCALLARCTLAAASMHLAHGSVEGTHYAARCRLAWCALAWCALAWCLLHGAWLGRAGHPRAFCISTSARSCTSSATTGAWPPCGTATIRVPHKHGQRRRPVATECTPRAANRHPIAAPTLLRSTHTHTQTHATCCVQQTSGNMQPAAEVKSLSPRRCMPCHAMPCHAMPCHAMPCHGHAMLATRTGAASTSTLVRHKLHVVQCTSYAAVYGMHAPALQASAQLCRA
jgi:hypothetical protein